MPVKRKKRILITNDDGYYSDGIAALYTELGKQHDVVMVAPDREQSASSHSLTVNHPLRVNKLDSRRYAIDGTPTDCVMLAIHLLFPKRKPDLIISGINHGANMGDDVTYSGTVAAAIEGSILGVPSLAVSMAAYTPGTAMKESAKFVGRFVNKLDEFHLPRSTFLNINIPNRGNRALRAYEFTSLGFRQYNDVVIHKTDPRGHSYYWIGGKPKWERRPGSDFDAVRRGVVSITPLKLQFTDLDILQSLKESAVKL